MSMEAQLARLALRLLADNPQEMYQVLDEFSKDMLARATALRAGEKDPFFNREKLLQEFVDQCRAMISVNDSHGDTKKILERELSSRMQGLPNGATFKID